MNYILEVKFDGDKHCLHCPLRNELDDSCKVQPDSDVYQNWEEQLKDCPLIIK